MLEPALTLSGVPDCEPHVGGLELAKEGVLIPRDWQTPIKSRTLSRWAHYNQHTTDLGRIYY